MTEGIEVVVLDGSDEMLDIGFAEELDASLEATPDERQTVLGSAALRGQLRYRVKALEARRGHPHRHHAQRR